jgi:hypothetical protein
MGFSEFFAISEEIWWTWQGSNPRLEHMMAIETSRLQVARKSYGKLVIN